MVSRKSIADSGGNKVTTHNLLKAYNQWNDEGEKYANKVRKLYEESK